MFHLDSWCALQLQNLKIASDKENIFPLPAEVTPSAFVYFEVEQRCLRIPIVLTRHAIFADNAHLVAKSLFSENETAQVYRVSDPFELPKDTPGPFLQDIGTVSSQVLEMVLVKLADNFTTYVTELIRLILKQKPELLKSKETLTYEFAMSFNTLEEMREALVERKVNDLAYLGFPNLLAWISSRLGFRELECLPYSPAIGHAIELRNCIVHNRSRVSQKLARSFGTNSENVVGLEIKLDMNDLYLAGLAANSMVRHLDLLAVTKFKLMTRANNV